MPAVFYAFEQFLRLHHPGRSAQRLHKPGALFRRDARAGHRFQQPLALLGECATGSFRQIWLAQWPSRPVLERAVPTERAVPCACPSRLWACRKGYRSDPLCRVFLVQALVVVADFLAVNLSHGWIRIRDVLRPFPHFFSATSGSSPISGTPAAGGPPASDGALLGFISAL